ncbi:putative RNA-directed DNA polymerase from transposon X-element [Grifola frondosa]|uniref:Putative RNA-directed DNA polymerase from transposon X-element n=1 Tax=Grifola frondosa TaxID=5627 RepID=A0A1C7MJI5_GRIFR|nr:putative RNA-directed DNA polymerase from transposon X-element [Grifola frondosa]
MSSPIKLDNTLGSTWEQVPEEAPRTCRPWTSPRPHPCKKTTHPTNETKRQTARPVKTSGLELRPIPQQPPPFPTSPMPERPNRPTRLRIWQQNLNKSLDAQLDLLHAADPDDYDLLLLQEPYLDHINLTRANHHWSVVYPTCHHDNAARTHSVILVSRKLSTGAWIPISIPSPDLTAITISTNSTPVHIFNAYIEGDKDRALHALSRATQHLTPETLEGRIIWAGDFNRHHPLWDSEANNHLFTTENLDRAQVLLNMVAELGLEMTLPQGIPTLEAARTKNLTRPDNVFCSDSITDAIISCNTVPELRPTKTDHMPIHTTVDLTIEAAKEPPRRNFRDVDWDEFQATLANKLAGRPMPEEIRTEDEFHATLAALMAALNCAVDRHVPFSKPVPFTKRWWTKELGAMRQKVQLLGHMAYKHRAVPFHPAQCEYRTAHNRYVDKIRAAKKEHWEAWLDDADKYMVWNVNKFIKGGPMDGGQLRVPPLKVDGARDRCTANDDKSKLLYDTFFPPPGPPQPRDRTTSTQSQHSSYVPSPACKSRRPSRSSSNTKPPGRTESPTKASFDLEIYPDEWKISKTVVLRKPDRPCYGVAKSYRPIALINCIAKILSACVTSVLVYEAEKTLATRGPSLRGRPGRTTTDSLQLITKTVKDAWRSGKVASILFLDIKAAFPSADPECLFHDMRMRGVPEQLTNWLCKKLRGRKTMLMFDDYASEPFEIHSGIDQGCPLSVILYQFYNSDLVSSARLKDGELAVGTMDDVAVIVTGKTFEDTHNKLSGFMTRRKGALTWSQTHNSEFSFDKLGLLNCSAKLKDLGPSLRMNDTVVKPSHHHKFLGVLLDHKLYFHEHVAYALAKGTTWVLQFRRLAKSRFGLTFGLVKRLHQQNPDPAYLS